MSRFGRAPSAQRYGNSEAGEAPSDCNSRLAGGASGRRRNLSEAAVVAAAIPGADPTNLLSGQVLNFHDVE